MNNVFIRLIVLGILTFIISIFPEKTDPLVVEDKEKVLGNSIGEYIKDKVTII